MADQTDQIIANIRACLISTKGGIPLPCLDRDYKVLIGHSIPFRKLGFDSLEQFLGSIPDVSISKRNGETILDAIPSKNTEHLASLVARQRSAPRKARPPLRAGQYRSAAMQWRPPPSSVRSAPKMTRRLNMNSRSQISPPSLLKLPKVSKPVFHERAVSPREEKSKTSRAPRFLKPKDAASSNDEGQLPQKYLPSKFPNALLVGEGIQSMAELEAQVKQMALDSSQPSSALHARLQKLQTSSIFHLADNLVSNMPRRLGEPDYERELRELTQTLGLELPVYTAVPRFPKGEPVMYNCKVKVGEELYTSFPDEDRLPAVALQRAARNALRELKKRYASSELGSGESLPVTQSSELIISRVSHLVASHAAGIWSFQVPLDYRKEFKENVPPNWLDIVRGCPQIYMETVANNRIILTKSVTNSVSEIENKVACSTNLQTTSKVAPNPITFPPGEVWDVYVTCAITTADVWVRLVGEEYSIRYEDMSADMKMHYMENSVQAGIPEVGNYYAVKLDDCWHRVEVLEIINNTEAVVFFLDHGDEDTFPLKMLHILEPKFTKLSAQAIQIALSGLEEFAEDPNATYHLVNTVVGRTLVAQVVTRPSPEDPDAAISVLLYDTSTDEDINVNRFLAERISEDARAARLSENAVVTEVFVSHVSDQGEVYINNNLESFNYLKSLMEKLMEGGIKDINIARAVDNLIDPTKLYLARYSVDYKYYRAKIISGPDERNWVTVQFVDYGNTESVFASSLFLLGLLSETLERFPYQAIKVVLRSVSKEAFGPRFVERFRELVKENEPVFMNVVNAAAENEAPEVYLFKRTEDKQLISINKTLGFDPEFVKPKQANENRVRRHHGMKTHPLDTWIIQDTSGHGGLGDRPRGLGVIQIPEVGQFFDVYVTMAANPGNFTVQPLKERAHLEDVMSKMQEYYNNASRTAVSPENVKEGGVFAAYHSDKIWYRVIELNVVVDSTVLVYFCDFGNFDFITLDKLHPLLPQFRILPALAIKAKLSRIVPIHGEWSKEDCLRFQERVVEKQFGSVIVDSGPDLLNPSDIVIGLQLYDTSGNIDIEIDGLLVGEKRAVFRL